MNWRELYEATMDVYRKSDILRSVLVVRVTAQEISDIVDRMETLPIGLQSYIAWDVICKPQTTVEIYERVRCNTAILAMTDIENIQSVWERNHACVSSI